MIRYCYLQQNILLPAVIILLDKTDETREVYLRLCPDFEASVDCTGRQTTDQKVMFKVVILCKIAYHNGRYRRFLSLVLQQAPAARGITMVMRSLKHMIKPHKRPNSVNNPHKRNPDKYFRSIWVSKALWKILELVAEIERKTPQAATIYLLEGAARQYIEEGLQVENDTRELIKAKLIPYKKPGRFITVLRGYLEQTAASIQTSSGVPKYLIVTLQSPFRQLCY